jgi:hypothetical protein
MYEYKGLWGKWCWQGGKDDRMRLKVEIEKKEGLGINKTDWNSP